MLLLLMMNVVVVVVAKWTMARPSHHQWKVRRKTLLFGSVAVAVVVVVVVSVGFLT
jgi:hypothetical protein